jgi:C4-dicarboxylate transporter, DctM subunit
MLAMRLAVPMVVAVGLDPIWFGGIVVCLMEVGAVTPPVGLNLFVVKASIPEASITDISVGSAPFWVVNIVAILIMYSSRASRHGCRA